MNERGEAQLLLRRRMNARAAAAAGMLALGMGLNGCSPVDQDPQPPVPERTATAIEPTVTPPETPAPTEARSPTPEITEPTVVEVCDTDKGVIVVIEESQMNQFPYSPNIQECSQPPEAPSMPEAPAPVEAEPLALSESLRPFVEQYGHLRDMGAVVYDWKTGEVFAYNEHKQFVSASLFKLYVAYGTLNGVDRGSISLNEVLPIAPAGDHDVFVPPEGLTVGECLTHMITISSNTCGSALNQRVGWSELDTLLDENGFSGTEMNPYRNGSQYSDRLTTAHDVATLFRRLYDGELLSSASSELLITHLRNQQLGYALPTGLHAGMTLDHKPGYLPSAHGKYSHDAGVIYGYGDQVQATLLTLDTVNQSPAVFTDFGGYVAQYMQR